ncbi:putative ferredoxin-like protein YdhY, partial [termite gut metagenome]
MKPNSNPITRKKFLRICGSVVAGASIASISGVTLKKIMAQKASYFWQIDPAKCTYCGRCETDCVLP